MSNDRTTRRPADPRKNAEALFTKTAPKPAMAAPSAAIPGAREQVTLRIDSAVLEHFQAEGPGWQDRINAALRQIAGLDGQASPDANEALTPGQLNSSNDV